MSRRTKYLVVGAIVVVIILAAMWFTPLRYYAARIHGSLTKRTVEQAVKDVGDRARERWKPFFDRIQVPYPPTEVVVIVCKDEKRLETWVRQGERRHHVRDYPILAASGNPGPKSREGDLQVPEGLYRIEGLNANSRFHLSMKLDYPNAFDRARAEEERRTNLGGDIFIHGSSLSVGCVAVGNEAIEDLFTLVADVGIDQVAVLIMPNDLRRAPPVTDMARVPSWTPTLYDLLKREVASFR